jgi:hypothetical protein
MNILIYVSKTHILLSCLTGLLNGLMDILVGESQTNRLNERMVILVCSWVVSFEVPEDVSNRISFVLRDAVYPDSQATVFRWNLLLRKKHQVLPKRWYLCTCMASHSSRS